MFIITDKQFEKMEAVKLDKVIRQTCATIKEEFPELIKETEDAFQKKVDLLIREASDTYKIKSFESLEDYVILVLQRPVIIEKPVPADILRILKWPGMSESDKMSELNILIEKKY